MTKHLNSNENVSFRETALSFSDKRVATMIVKLEESFARRDDFETLNGLDVADKSTSYSKAKARMLSASVAVARFFLALDVAPSAVIERQAVEGAMFNAKALEKVAELALFSCGIGERLQRVTRAFIACALIATDRGVAVIDNKVNARFLDSSDLSQLISDRDILDNLDALRLKSMSSGYLTQSSQARNVLDVLGLGSIKSVERARDAIELNATHAFYAHFRTAFMR